MLVHVFSICVQKCSSCMYVKVFDVMLYIKEAGLLRPCGPSIPALVFLHLCFHKSSVMHLENIMHVLSSPQTGWQYLDEL